MNAVILMLTWLQIKLEMGGICLQFGHKIKEKSNQIGTTNKGPDETILRFKGRKW